MRKVAMAVTLVLVVGVVTLAWTFSRPLCTSNLTLPECQVTIVGSKVVSEVPGFNESGLVTWVTNYKGEPADILLVALKIEPPAGNKRTFEISDCDLVLGFQPPGEKFADRTTAETLAFSDKRPDLNSLPLMEFPSQLDKQFTTYREESSSPFYLIAGFPAGKNCSQAQLYLAQPDEVINLNR